MTSVEIVVGICPRCFKPWTACECGKPTPPGALDGMEPEPATPAPFVEWVRWTKKDGEPSLFHVRVTSGGWLLCGRKAPLSAAADSLPPAAAQKCAVCLGKLAS